MKAKEKESKRGPFLPPGTLEREDEETRGTEKEGGEQMQVAV